MTSRSSACVVVEELELWPPSPTVGRSVVGRSVGRGRLCWRHGLAAAGEGVGDGSQVFTASMLTVLRLINLTVALAAKVKS